MMAYLVGAARTPIGGFGGALASLSAPELGAAALRAAIERAGVSPATVEQVIMGNVIAANASTIADGAAALVVASEEAVRRHGLAPRARIIASAVAGRAPEDFRSESVV